MGGCFGNSPIDRWLERLTDEYTDPPIRKLSAREREKLEEIGLDESDIWEGKNDSKTDNF